MKTITFIISLILLCSISTYRIVKSIEFDKNCDGYLERAANATTPETAHKEITKAITYLDANNLTSGYTSIFYTTPDEDVAYWYNNLKDAQTELAAVTDKTSSLEKTNILLKLRENLMTHNDKSQEVIIPSGLSIYPNNSMMFVLSLLFFLMTIGFGINFGKDFVE